MKTVIQVFGSLDAGGAESRMMDVFRAIDRSKYRFIFVSLDTSEGQFYEEEIRSLGAEIIKIESPRRTGVWRHFRQLHELFLSLNSAGKADCVHAHTSYHIGIVLLAAHRARIPVRIAHARTTSSINRGGLANKLMIAVGKRLIKSFATHRLALNEETALSLYGSVSGIQIIPNAIPLELYSEALPADIYADIPADATVICHIGRFQPMKNHEFLLKLFAEYLKEHPDSWLILVGEGPLRPAAESLVKELNIGNRVKFTGLRRDIPQILSRASVFVFPSKYEGLGGVVLEAQAAGVGCVVSDTLPRNVDMGLDMVDFVSLEASVACWVEAIDKSLSKSRPDYEARYAAFDRRGFTLEHEIKLLTSIYENADNNHHNI